MITFSQRYKRWYQLIVWLLLIISLGVLFSLSPILTKPDNIIADDFSQFWAAGKLNLTGGNPYNPEEIKQTIQKIGGKVSDQNVISIMLNPPWTLSVIMPFALLEYPLSRLFWLLLSVAVVITSIKILWDIYEGQKKNSIIVVFLVLLFSPALSAIQKGQYTPIVLIGIALALYNINFRNGYWTAGIFLAFASLKPQLIYLFWVVLFLWSIYKGRWQLLISIIITIIILTTIPYMINPNVLNQYIQTMGDYPISEWATPTLGTLLRLTFGINKFWLQFLPMAIGTITFSVYWLRHKKTWNWIEGSPLIIATSMFTTAYAWSYDAILFIIPIVYVFILVNKYASSMTRIIAVSSLLIISILNLLLHIRFNDFWFFWLLPSLFLWYLYSIKSRPAIP